MKTDEKSEDTELSFAEQLDAAIEKGVAEATEADMAKAAAICKPDYFNPADVIEPIVGALILKMNDHNRRISPAQVDVLQGILARGEWRRVHQGVAFYEDGSLMDGQHRIIAGLLSGVALNPIMVSGGYAKTDNDAIDAGTRRTAGDAAALAGIKEAAIKCHVVETWLKYKHLQEYGIRANFTNHQIKVKAMEFDAELTRALAMADSVLKACAINVMTRKEIGSRAFEMVNGGWSSVYAQTILTLINQGTADYDGAPTVFLSEAYAKDRDEKSKFKLSALERQAMFHKVADLYAHKKRVTKSAIAWKSGSPLPQMKPTDDPDGTALAAE